MPEPASAILFDIDGTLVDSTYHHAIAWERAFDRFDLHLPIWRIHRTIGMGGDKLVAEVAGDEVEQAHGDAIRAAWREEFKPLLAEIFPLPGATDLVRSVRRAGYQAALASSGDPEFSRDFVDTLGIADDIDLLTTSEDADDSKPHPDLIEVTLERCRATRGVLLGDTPYDVEAAERAGIRCIGLRSGGYSAGELTDAGAVLVVDAPEDLLEVDWEKYLADGVVAG